MNNLNRRQFVGATAGLLAAPSFAAQDAWPTRPITMIVPFAPAGSNDIIARIIAKEMGQSVNQPVVVDNRPGAGSMVGAGILAKAPPDGYTLMLSSSSVTLGLALKPNLPFDWHKDFTPIAMAAAGPMMVVASNKLAANNPKELVALARANPGKLTFGSSGIGSVPHMGMELLAMGAGVKLLHVPYKGGSPVLNDMMAGQLDLYLGSLPQVLPLVRAGKIKAIGITSLERSPLEPNIAPVADAVPDFKFDLWWGVFAPGNMPHELVTRLNAEVNKAVQSPAMQKFAENEGVMVGKLNADEFAKVYVNEIRNWQAVAKKTNVKLE